MEKESIFWGRRRKIGRKRRKIFGEGKERKRRRIFGEEKCGFRGEGKYLEKENVFFVGEKNDGEGK